MTDLQGRLAGLSPEKRRLLELRMQLQRTHAAGPALVPRPRTGPLPLSFSQRRLWVLDRLDPGSTAFNLMRPLRLHGVLDVAALERALDAVRARHESLRTTFTEGADGAPVQVVHPFAPVPLPVEDLAALADEAREAAVHDRVHADAATGFDLVAGPLFRARLLRLRDDEHVLLLAMHHVISDGWSLGILASELGALYAAFRAGAPDPLPALPVQYADYAAWQREHLSGATLEKQRAFWRGALAGAPPALELPTDAPRPPAERHRGRVWHDRMEPELGQRIRALAAEERTTPFAVLLAGLRAVLARWSGQEDVVIGAPVAGRGRTEVEGLIGFFVNTLPLRGQVRADDTFRALVRREKAATLAAFDHQDLPFERIVEELRIARDLSRNPVFQVSLMLQNTGAGGESLAGIEIAPLRVEYDTARFDLAFDLYEEAGGGFWVETEYATDLFEHATAGRMVAHLKRLLGHGAAKPDALVSRLPLVDDDERAAVVEQPNATARDWPFTPMHRLFAEQAARTPDAVAVEGADGALTYAELDAVSAGVAAALRARGAGRGTIVAVGVERSARMVAALLGVLRAGAAYLPLDRDYPAERLAYMLDDSGARLLLTERALADRFPTSGIGRVLLDDVVPADSVDADADAEVSAEDLAYVIYTSGSTGRPKGVMVRHGGAGNFLRSMAEVPGLRPDDVLLAVTTIAFDISVLELFLPLSLGARTVVATREQAADPTLLAALLARSGASVMQATPATWAMLLASGWTPRAGMRLFTGGEALPRTVADALLAAGAEVWNLYGPTETTVWSAAARVPAEGAIPLGEAIGNTTLYVLDPAGNPAPLGIPGELFIGGDGVTRGYLDRPGLTAERFVPDPFGAAGSRLYRTGDRVRRRTDGALEFLGRVDFQVKLRGFRIELGEIEGVLRAHPGVREAVALVRTEAGDARLVAYTVPRAPDAPPASTELRAFLRERLPDYMVPSAFVALDAFPLTPAGKLDRRALPAPDAREEARVFVPPRTPREEAVAEIWREVLRRERVGAEDDFFELGGHSLLATQVLSRVRRELGVELPLRAMFEAPTVRALAERLDAGSAATDGPPLVRVERAGPVPLSFAQERMWFLQRMSPASGAYNIAEALQLQGPLDVDALRRAFEALLARHETLRTRYPEVDGQPVQDVLPQPRFTLPVDDVAEDEVRGRAEADVREPFDLREEPPVRARLLRIAPERHVLLLNVHHIAADGWSWGVMMRELTQLYRAFVAGGEAALPELPVQYADYALWQRTWLNGDAVRRERAFWRERLAGAPALLELPYDRPRPAEADTRGAMHHFTIVPEVARAARELARREGATLYMVLLAAWSAVLHRWSGQTDVVVGSPVAGRGLPEVEGLVGLFVNALAMRTDVGGDPPFRTLLARVRESTLQAYAHQDVPFEELLRELGVQRSLSHAPVFQVMFSLLNAPAGEMELEGLRVRPLPDAGGTARVDLTVQLEEEDDEALRGLAEYATALWDAATMERMMAHFAVLLPAAAADPDARISRLPLLSDAERAVVVREENATERDWPFVPVHRLFAEQAARTPDAAAVEGADGALTYAQVDALSAGVAAALRARGAGRGCLVAVCAERSARMVAALLGVLRTGAAYLPLDPAYPAERLAYMLEDSGAPILLLDGTLADRLPASSIDRIVLDGIGPADGVDADAEVGAEELAYVIYTSGSTGRPKGVMVRHGGVSSFLRAMAEAPGLRADDTLLAVTTIAFDISVLELFLPLTLGARTVVATREQAEDPRLLAALIARSGATAMQATPATWAMLLASGWTPDAGMRLLSGGEALPRPIADALLAAGAEVWNLYGPTETTVWSAAAPVPAEGCIPLGAPIGNTTLYVLDPAGNPAPLGIPGELFIGGHGVARGYLNRPGLTAERFVPDPFGAAGSRLYRTGDRVRRRVSEEMDPTAANSRTHALTHSRTSGLEFLGRVDFQVKLRGFRIELGEIESALRAHPAVGGVAAAVRGEGADARLVAYLLPRAPDAPPAGAELRAFLRERLPEYMVPSAFVALDAFPLTPNGKVDRKALPMPDARAAEAGEAPRGPTEQLLAGIWAELLGTGPIHRGDSFFERGGHSLLAARLMSRIDRLLGVELPLRAVFAAPTLAALAAEIDTARAAADGAVRIPPIRARAGGEPAVLSFAQERMWFLDRLAGAAGAYNIPLVLDLAGPLDVEALRGALGDLAARHEALRTRIADRDGRPVAAVAAPGPFALAVTQVAEGEVEARVEEEISRAFDLSHDLPVRAALFGTAADTHVLALTLHHVAADGWSIGILLRELAALYAARVEGKDAALPPLAVRYADYAAWQRGWLQGDALKAQTAYWRGALEGAAPLALPTDRPRPARQSFRGALHTFRIPPEVAERARALAGAEHVTPFMATLAAFQALLGRYAGQDDVVVGTPVAGRHRPETEPVVGLFVNTLPLRTSLEGDPTFRELVRRVRETTLDAYAHQDLPFERLVDELKVERRLDRTPVFQTVFSFDAASAGGFALPGVEVRERSAPHRTAKFDLVLNLEAAEGGFTAYLEYATDLFDAATAGRIGEHYLRLLDQALADPDRRLSTLDPVTEAERARVAAWSAGAAHPAHLALPPVHVQVARHAARAPDAPAVVDGGETLTYAELDARANRLANRLRRMGVGPDTRVAVMLERSAALLVAQLAVLRAGGAYLPLDPAAPAGRAATMLRAADAAAVLTRTGLRAGLPEAGIPVLALDEEAAALASESADAPAVEIGADHLAYVIFTSGSTGVPKGVGVPHCGLSNLTGWFRADRRIGPGDRGTMMISPAFDGGVLETWTMLASGAAVHVVPDALRTDAAGLLRWMDAHGITLSMAITPVAEALMEAMDAGGPRPAALRVLSTGGDALRRRPPAGLRLVNLYGPTENSVASTGGDVAPEGAGLPSIGRPVPNHRAYVLDARLHPVPVGVPGELYVAGPGLARGYVGRAALTAERFLPDPSGAPGARMYATGDRVRWRADGDLEFLGRADHQVKVRGHRIETGEIEAALLAHPALAQAAVVLRPEGGGRLVAYAAPAAGARVPPADELRAHLRERLPDYMVPAAFVAMDALPRSTTGKVDRRALPEPAMDAAEGAAPATETERALAGVWAELLGVPAGREDGFFDLGGHSLLAMQLLARVRRTFGIDLPIRAVFEAPSLREMAAGIDAGRESAGDASPEIVPIGRDGALPLSFAQERMWFIDRMLPGNAVYSVPLRVRLRGEVRPEALRRALERVVHRHDSLRTVFPSAEGRPLQVVHPPAPFALPMSDLAVLPADVAEREAQRMADEDARRPFDLAAGPLLRAGLIRVADEAWVLLLNLHHVIADGWSVDILFRELAQAYAAHAEGRDPELPPLAVQYPDYAAWQREWLTGARLERQIGWWRERLAGVPVLELPTDRPRPATPSFRGGAVEFRVDAQVARRVDDLARAEGATRFQLLLGAFQLLLARWSGQDDVVVGSPVAGRGRPETEGMIGLFVNTLALRTDLSGDPAFREVIGRVRETALGAVAHQDVPFERLVDELRIDRSLSRHPLFQVSFSLQQPGVIPPFGAVETTLEPGENGTAKFDLVVAVEPEGDGFVGGIQYAADLFDHGTAKRMAEHFTALLASLVADPDRPVSRLPGLLRGGERRRVLEEWSGADHPVPQRPAHHLIAETAARTPDAPALAFRGRTIRYREMDEAANRLAHHLIARGAGRESIVGILAERTPETVIAILAVLKAGGAYVPLDPSNPVDRLRYMLADCGARLVVSPGPLPAALGGIGAEVVDVRAEAAAIVARPATDPAVPCDADNLAYVIYTSGSTGRPKGVAVAHRGVPNLAHMQRSRMGVHAGDRVLQFAAFSFDVSAEEVFATLIIGACLVLAPRDELMPGPPLQDTLRRERISVCLLPPAALPLLSPQGLPELRALLMGGEALSAAAAARWAGVVQLHNVYGPTECTVASTSEWVAADGRDPDIGAVLDNLRGYVVDRAGQPVPVGVPGELLLGGMGLARGYLNRPALTAERFIPNPFGAPGSRLYRTGDRVRWRADGRLSYLGRFDHQVKLRGFRIELGEIAARLMEFPGVRDALVLVRPGGRGEPRLVGWVLAPEHEPSASELREHLRRALPDYMVPQAYVVMDAFPHTPNGKLDHAALPAPADPGPAESAAPPQGELERAIAAVWRDVLGLESVGVNDSFFEVGGHSLLLARLQEALRGALGRDVSIIDLFQYPTVGAFAAHLDAQTRRAEPEDAEKAAGRGRGASRREMLMRGRK
ncbi:amino acid adenylation domain-containing protein [Longimicrobium sp.]|uniref:amino acid adenylation domain-containing protein n=1 Tax=Longimicrobium sp. TaxID=2029185 RepID=UPI003B3B3AF4